MHTGISLIQEPWINLDATKGLRGGGIFCYRYREAPKARKCMLAKNVSIVLLLYFCSRDLMMASVDLTEIGKLVFRSVVKKSEKISDGPRKAIRKNYETYPM